MASTAIAKDEYPDNGISKQETEDEFSERITRIIQASFTPFGIAFGVKLGLFDSLASFDQPKTSDEIANLTRYKERYIREWLGQMTVDHIIDYDPTNKTYWLPTHRRKAVSGTEANVGVLAGLVPTIAPLFPDLLQCVQLDGPPGYGMYEKKTGFADAIAEIRECSHTWTNLKVILHKMDGLLEMLEKGIAVCEIGCSTGVIAIMLAQQFPRSTFHALDIDQNAVKIAQEKAEEKGLQNITFKVQDICETFADWSDIFDLVYINDVLHHFPYPSKVLGVLYKALKPDSYMCVEEFNFDSDLASNVKAHWANFFYGVSLLYCLPEGCRVEDSDALGGIYGKQNTKQLIENAGFSVVVHEVKNVAVFACKKN